MDRNTASSRLPVKAAVLAFFGIFSTVLMDAAAKCLAGTYPIGQIGFFRSAIALIPMCLFILYHTGRDGFATRYPLLQILRGSLMVGGTLFFFTGLAYLQLSEATVLFFTEPFFVIAFSALIMGEKSDFRFLLIVALGFVGALIMLKPTSNAFRWEAVYPLMAAALSALWMILGRLTANTDAAETSAFYTLLVAALLCAGIALFNWSPIKSVDLPVFVLMGLLGGLSTYFYTAALKYSSATTIAPIDYSALILAAIIGFVLWRDLPDLSFLIAASLIVFSGAYALRMQATRKVS